MGTQTRLWSATCLSTTTTTTIFFARNSMANADTTSERTPLLHPQEDSLPQERASSNGRERHISDALSRIVSATSLDCLVPSDLLNLNAVPTGLSDPEASAEDYAYTLTALLAYREQQLAQITSATSKLDLYGQWTQDTSAEGDVKLLERHVDVVWGQFLSLYRTDREVDAVIWTSFRKDETSAVWLRGQRIPLEYTATTETACNSCRLSCGCIPVSHPAQAPSG